ncbi:MAG: hypothetical protein QXQ47_02290 [Candidatus Bathyarchaeia archaeon]
MNASSCTLTANKRRAPIHPHTNTTTKPHIKPPQNCTYAIPDNHTLTNCTRNDSTIGLCTTPCPYNMKLHQHQLTRCTYISLEAQIEAETAREAQSKSRYALYGCTYILTVAAGADV